MANLKITKDLSDSVKAAAILADFFGFKSTYTDVVGSRGGQILNDKAGNNNIVTFKGSNDIPLKIGDNWYFCDTDVDITIPNDLDDYLADDVVEDGSGTWTAGANVTASTDAGQVKLAVAAGAGAAQNIGYIDFAAKDFSTAGKNAISFLITSSITLGAGALQFMASDSSALATPAEALNIPALKANVQTRVILSFASASAARDAILSIGLYAVTDFGAADIWIDDIKTTSLEAGKDYFVYACDNSGTLTFRASKASTYPAGFAAATSRKLGGLHALAGSVFGVNVTLTAADTPHTATAITIDGKVYTFRASLTPTEGEVLIGANAAAALDNLKAAVNHTGTPDTDYKCAAAHPTVIATTNTDTTQVFENRGIIGDMLAISTSATHLTLSGTRFGNSLNGYLAGEINPYSIWDLKHRPRSNPAGMTHSPRTGKWVDIYLSSGLGTPSSGEVVTAGAASVSVNGGTIDDTINWMAFVDAGAAVGKRLPSDSEFQSMAKGSNEETAVFGAADPVTTGPHADTAGRRMISNIGCEDMCGTLSQWLLDQSYRYDSDGTMIAAAKTYSIAHEESPGGNPIYVKYGSGRAYLCSNLATAGATAFVTFGAAAQVTIPIVHDAGAGTGGYQVYFHDDATNTHTRLLCTLPGGYSEFIDTSDPNYPLKVTHDAAASSNGVALYYNDAAGHLHLECNNSQGAAATLDLASYGLAFAAYDLPGAKGSMYRQSSYGDVKLLAGGGWYYSSNCGSRCRYASRYRWDADTYFGARFVSEPL